MPHDSLEWWYDKNTKAIWLVMNLEPRQCYTIETLEKATEVECLLNEHFSGFVIDENEERFPVWHYITASSTPGIFNLGGDLFAFRRAILDQQPDTLLKYGLTCVDLVYYRYMGFNNRLITWSFVDGDAFGGGFETALACDYIAATEAARFGCPEARFGFYPGMGAYTFISRRTSRKATEEIISKGDVHTCMVMHNNGIVDYVVSDRDHFDKLLVDVNKNIVNVRGMCYARRQANRVSEHELENIVRRWAVDAMDLSERDLRLMEKIVVRQTKDKAK